MKDMFGQESNKEPSILDLVEALRTARRDGWTEGEQAILKKLDGMNVNELYGENNLTKDEDLNEEEKVRRLFNGTLPPEKKTGFEA